MHYFNPKDEGEQVTLTFDFSAQLADGDTLATLDSVTPVVWDGDDPYVAAMVQGSVLSGDALSGQATVNGGRNGNNYLFTAAATTASGEQVKCAGLLPVRRAT